MGTQNTLGDFVAKGVITIALVTEGNETLEDLGIECLTPGQTIIKCLDAKAVKPIEQANACIDEWDEGSAAWVLQEYASGKLLRDVDRDCDVEIAVADLNERIAELEDELRATKCHLKLAQGQLQCACHNHEAQKGKLQRKEDSLKRWEKQLEERDALPPDDAARKRIGKLETERDSFKAECEHLRSVLVEICEKAREA